MRWLLSLLLLFGCGYLLTGMVEVRPGEQAVIRRFGRILPVRGPGLWFGLPWGMDRVDRVAVDRVRQVSWGYQPGDSENPEPEGQLLTGDHNLVNVQLIVHYTVKDAARFAIQEDRADELIMRAAESVAAEWMAARPVDEILVQGKTRLPGVVVPLTQERIEPYGLGIQIQQADVAHLYPPEEVKHAFEEVTRAQASIVTREQEARQESTRLLREAETDRYRIERDTEAYVNEHLRLAKAEAQRFLERMEQYHRLRGSNPDYLAGIWWEEIGTVFAKLRESGRIDLLDNHIGQDGLDISVFPPSPKSK
jgi:membrane protease subunit HflK